MGAIGWTLIAAGGVVFLLVIGVMIWSLAANADSIDSRDPDSDPGR